MILGAGQWWPGGEHVSSWRRPEAEPDHFLDLDYYVRMAQAAERGKFDTIFFADELYVWDRYRSGVESASNIRPEPFTLLGALAATTDRIGLAATVSSTYNAPYHAARRVASLDHLSKGRAAWNLVTSACDEEARNFGRDKNLDHSTRYARAREFVDVMRGLFDSYDDDALPRDKASAAFADPDKIHTLNHVGEHFTVRGPLNVARPPQGHPVLFQAGASPAGKDLAAATAEAVFTYGGTLGQSRETYIDLKRRASGYGRDPDTMKVLPLVMPVIAGSAEEALEKANELVASTPEQLALDLIAHHLEVDLTGASLNEPLRFVNRSEISNQSKTIYDRIASVAGRDDVTLREVYRQLFFSRITYGTGRMIADDLELRFRSQAADGFIIMFTYLPDGIDEFVDAVLPHLVERGLFRSEYEGTTLREHLGLARPESVHRMR